MDDVYTSSDARSEQPADVTAADKTHVHTLVDDVRSDIADRSEWADRVKKNRANRFKTKATPKPAYPGAPNMSDPLIDDLIRDVRGQQVGLLFQSAALANFIPAAQEAVHLADLAERVFDDHLRNVGFTRRAIEAIFDSKLCDGMGVAKQVSVTCADGDSVPHFTVVDPLDVVVPSVTRDIADADRVCHVLNYTRSEFAAAVGQNGWDAGAGGSILAAVKEKSGGGGTRSDGAGDESGAGRGQWRDGRLSDSHGLITVWEIYYVARAAGNRRMLCAVSPDYPQWPLKDAPWEHAPIVTGVVAVIAPDGSTVRDPATGEPMLNPVVYPVPVQRRWPFFQFRNEGRSLDYYDTRGLGELCEQDQREASGFRTARLIANDYACKPFLSGTKKPEMFKMKPGEWIGDVEIKFFAPPADALIYQADYARAASTRRAGSQSGALSSADPARDKKTATEVATTQQQSVTAAANDVDIAAEPLSALFAAVWTEIALASIRASTDKDAKPPSLSASVQTYGTNGDSELMACFKARFIIACGMSGRSANSVMQLQQLATVADFASKFPQISAFVKGYDLAKLVWSSINPAWARAVMIDPQQAGPGGAAPIEQQVAAMAQQLAELSKVAYNQNQYLTALAREEEGADGGVATDRPQEVVA